MIYFVVNLHLSVRKLYLFAPPTFVINATAASWYQLMVMRQVLSVFLSFCPPVWITQKVMNGFWWNFLDRPQISVAIHFRFSVPHPGETIFRWHFWKSEKRPEEQLHVLDALLFAFMRWQHCSWWRFEMSDHLVVCEQTQQTWSQIVPVTRLKFTDSWWRWCSC